MSRPPFPEPTPDNQADLLRPRLTGAAEFEMEVSKLYRIPPSRLRAELTPRDWAYLRESFARHGTFEPLSVRRDDDQ